MGMSKPILALRNCLLFLLVIVICRAGAYFASTVQGSRAVCSFEGVAMSMPYRFIIGQPLGYERQLHLRNVIADTFHDIDVHCNIWNPNSELAMLNRNPCEKVAVSSLLFDLLQKIDICFRATGGRFDPSIGKIWSLWKHALKDCSIPSRDQLTKAQQECGWSKVLLNADQTITKHKYLEIDACGIAKGFCLDLLKERIKQMGITSALLEWGGEICAIGSHSSKRPWRVAIEDTFDGDRSFSLGVALLTNRSLASSGIAQQSWMGHFPHEIKRVFHFVNTTTLEPLDEGSLGIVLCSVESEECAIADALSTACMFFSSKKEIEHWFYQQSLAKKLWVLFKNGESCHWEQQSFY